MRFLIVMFVALACVPAAWARTDAGRQLELAWPADGTLTGEYGESRGGRSHDGLDIGILRDSEVTAAAAGRVVAVGEQDAFAGYGTVVRVQVGFGFTTLYAHLASTSVRPGELVVEGQRLGTAGCTGWCTGTHVHFELRYRGRAVDPSALFVAPMPAT